MLETKAVQKKTAPNSKKKKILCMCDGGKEYLRNTFRKKT